MFKVLLVDDETINYQLFEKMVDWKKKGFEIVGTATDGQEALQKYEEYYPDLIFMDIQMHGMDGLECVRCIREADQEVKIVIVSAYGEFSYAQRAIRYGVDDFLLKPVSRMILNQLVDKIGEELSHRSRRRRKSTDFYGGEHETYTVGMIPVQNLEQQILRAYMNNDASILLTFVDEIFQYAKEQMLQPDILKNTVTDVLLHMKYTMTRLEQEGTFSIMRVIQLEDIQQQSTARQLRDYVTQHISETFEEINQKFFAKDKNLVFRTHAYTDLHYRKSGFSVQEVAEHNGLSKNYFASRYKEETGMGFWEYVTGLRIARAKELLVSTDELISTISAAIGYESEYHFSRKFKEVTGESPNHYRKKYKQNHENEQKNREKEQS